MTTITITEAARSIIAADVAAHSKAMLRHAEYVKETGMNLADVADHVALFRTAYRVWADANVETAIEALDAATARHDAKATKSTVKAVESAQRALVDAEEKATGAAVKAYATKVRNGLNRALNKPVKENVPSDVLAAFVTAYENAEDAGFTRAEILALIAETDGEAAETV